ncbi:hypothetical protein [Paenibacillus woosongensis]|uniref:Uncharacterized protein n=1 Tax=Paenibacillus woosongensis TaxID=307580 RepID=A0A7X3CMC1_9BACL|nr:hypothetical protein [Paenibacillus woosongensis]MUG45493.1 hypothetical protein [Paenibacillus woosongensis]
MIEDRPIMRSMMGERIWRLMQSDPEGFKRETRNYFARAYPGWTVIRVRYPFVFLRDDRGNRR